MCRFLLFVCVSASVVHPGNTADDLVVHVQDNAIREVNMQLQCNANASPECQCQLPVPVPVPVLV